MRYGAGPRSNGVFFFFDSHAFLIKNTLNYLFVCLSRVIMGGPKCPQALLGISWYPLLLRVVGRARGGGGGHNQSNRKVAEVVESQTASDYQ